VKLSHHFTLAEFTRSSTAQRLGLDNTPPPELLPRLVRTAEMLERVRSTLRCPVIITSGYRSPAVNAAVGSRSTSDHTQGHAADIVVPMFGSPTEVARVLAPLVSVLNIGQIILEGVGGKQWVHLSTHEPEKSINRILTITDAGTVPGIVGLA
jgi:zinc D-Ala-D-Ala carboxypeptidase